MVPAVETARDRGEAANFFLPGKFWDTTYWIILGRDGGMGGDGGWDGGWDGGSLPWENPWEN